MKSKILLSVITLLFGIQLNAQTYFPPLTGTTWSTINPSTLGWCQDSIDKMYQWLENTDSKAFIVLKDGKIVLEKYFGTFTADSLHVWNSAGKTLTAYTVGIAQYEGFLSIDDTTSHYLGNGWTSMTPAQENAIKIRHQLSMTTGLDDGVPDPFCTLPSCLQYKAAPGTRWAYHNGPYTLLDSVIKIATGQSLNVYVNQKIGAKIGMQGLYVTNGYNHIFVSKPRSMARFGLLLSQNGSWNGTPVLPDPSYLSQMVNSSQSLNNSYGYLTWLNGKSSYMIPSTQFVFNGMLCPNAPADMFAAEGKNGQIINVVPSENIVLIRMGESNGTSLVSTQYNDTIWQYMNRLSCSLSTESNDFPSVSIAPNPFSHSFHITGLVGDEKLELLNTLGQSIDFQQNSSEIVVNSSISGVFFLKISTQNRTKVYKLIHN